MKVWQSYCKNKVVQFFASQCILVERPLQAEISKYYQHCYIYRVAHKQFYFYGATAKHTHGLAIDICMSVRLSVRPSVKRVHCDKTKALSEKSSIMTNRKSPASFPMSLR